MRASHIAVAAATAGLLGFGVWLGRASSGSTPPASGAALASAPVPTASLDDTPTPVERPPAAARARVAPQLPTRAPAATGLAADLGSSDPGIRRAAVRELAAASDPDPQALLAASRDSDVETAGVAMQRLGGLYAAGQVTVKDIATRATDHATSERVRMHALNALGAVENAEAAALLVELLARGDTLERRVAAAQLATQDMAIAVPALIRALGDGDEIVRANALEALRARSRGRDFGTDAAAWTAWWQSRSR
ncbi:MAG TPA: HEAT repeat domain-containing protein [Kofleriaceae bacterium]|nr:HEAT repeat domain-containing protein [Kofleriaceae bacterium]